MDLLKQTQQLCKLYEIKPARSKGQNFLIRESVYDSIIMASELKTSDMVMEVGPGLGFLTAKLAKKVKMVTAVELDDKLASILQIGLNSGDVRNVEVINENVLDFDLSALRGIKYKIVANLPYNITSVFLRKFLEAENKPESIVLMLQKEVVERMVAKPGEMSLLGISVQFYAEPELIAEVPAKDFWPKPEVDSAIVKLKVKSEKLAVNEKEFFRLVKFGFMAKRKMLKNNLAGGYRLGQSEVAEKLKQAGFNEKIRAQELSVDDWIKLSPFFQK